MQSRRINGTNSATTATPSHRDAFTAHCLLPAANVLERETGIEPATNSLEGCDSTTELLPPTRFALRRGTPALRQCPSTPTPLRTFNRLALFGRPPPPLCGSSAPASTRRLARRAGARSRLTRAEAGGEGRVRTSVATRAADLQSAAIDRSATSPRKPVPHAVGTRHGRGTPPGATRESARVSVCLGIRVFGASLKMRLERPMELAEGFEPPTG